MAGSRRIARQANSQGAAASPRGPRAKFHCRHSSVVEHVIGNDGVDCSIQSGGTIFSRFARACRRYASCILIREGYARPWRGRGEDWCVKVDPPEIAAEGINCAVTSSLAPPPNTN